MGHQRQMRQHAPLPALRRQVPRLRRALCTCRGRKTCTPWKSLCAAYMAQGYRYVRCSIGGAGPGNVWRPQQHHAVATPGTGRIRAARLSNPAEPRTDEEPDGVDHKALEGVWEPTPYARLVPRLFEHLRNQLGDGVELLHDVHERLPPVQALGLAKALEPYHLFFLEDPLAPEDNGYFRIMRQQTTTPIAMGELS